MDFRGAIFDQDGLLFDTEAVFQVSWVASFLEELAALR